MSKRRVAIRAFTCRRDAATAELLARVLRGFNCEALVTSMRDFNRTLRYWKPHVAVVNTPSQSERVKVIAPEVTTVWLDGEGFLPIDFSHADTFSKKVSMYRATDLALLWGQTVKDQLTAELVDEDLTKIHVVGNPTYDLLKFREHPRINRTTLDSIGVVMRYGTINNHSGIPPVRTLPNPGNLERVIVECQSFVGIIECVRELLSRTNYRISIRPHPLEQVESYLQFKDFWFGAEHSQRVTIDDSLSFSHWAEAQRVVLSPTSTTLLEAYLLKLPVINIDGLSGTKDFYRSYADMTKLWQESGILPSSIDELIEIIDSRLPEVVQNEKLDTQLRDYCSYYKGSGSACLAAARLISSTAANAKSPVGPRLPRFFVELADELSFRRAQMRDNYHHNMNYRRSYHALPWDLDNIATRILDQSSS